MTWLDFGTTLDYAMYHLTGTAHMPARIHMGFTEITVDASAERLIDYTLEHVIAAG